MAVDATRARVPFTRVVQVTKKRADEAADSNLATARGDDLATTQIFSPDGFTAFLLTAGANSPNDREARTQYAVSVPDAEEWLVTFYNAGAKRPPLRKVRIEASFSGSTSMAVQINNPVVVGGLSAFADLAETFVEPVTVPDEFPAKLFRYENGSLIHDEVFRGRIRIMFTSTLDIDTGADTPFIWTVQSSIGTSGVWADVIAPGSQPPTPLLLAEDSLSSVLTPLHRHYRTPWIEHFKDTRYRVRVSRSSGPAGAITLTATNPIFESELLIRQT